MAMRVVNLRDSSYTTYIGRAGRNEAGTFGNPFVVGKHGARGECCTHFSTLIWGNGPDDLNKCASILGMSIAQVTALRIGLLRAMTKLDHDAVLGCFCKPAKCHGDVIKDWFTQYTHDSVFRSEVDSEIAAFDAAQRAY